MKYVFFGCLLGLCALSVVAWFLKPRAADDGKIEIVWATDDNPVRRDQIALFNRLYPKYRLRLDPQSLGMEKVIVQCLAGVGPDLFDCYSGFQRMAFVRSGAALDVTDTWAKNGMRREDVWPCLVPLFADETRIHGHPDNTHAPAMWFNKDLFDKAGIAYPTPDWTWDECVEIARRLTVRDARGRPLQFGLLIPRWDWYATFVPQWGGRLYTKEGTRCILDAPESVAGAQFLWDLLHKYRVAPDLTDEIAVATAGGWGSGPITLLGAERGAMATGGRWWLCMLRNKDYAHLRLGAVTLPKGPVNRLYGGGRATMINAAGHNIEGAWCFFEFMHGREWNQLINQQADGIGPVIAYHYGPYEDAFLDNPGHPEEDYNAMWRAALEGAEAMEVSPFVNGQAADRIMREETDKLFGNLKSAEDAMRDAARKINAEIVDMLRRDPVLRKEYYATLAGGARSAWDRAEDAP